MDLTWRKSSYSNGATNTECVEVASLAVPLTAVRDSKNPAVTLTFPTTPWHAFLASLSDQRG